MKRDTGVTFIATVVALTFAGVAGHSQGQIPEERALGGFQQSINDYAALHRRLEKVAPPLNLSSDAKEIFDASDALAAALQSARASAREGDIFNAVVGDLLRIRLARTLADRGLHFPTSFSTASWIATLCSLTYMPIWSWIF